jgi:SanA protein
MVYIHFFAKPFIYTDIESVPFRDVGIVLGTSPYMSDGGKNVFFEGRIEATRRLYESGKIRHIIVSGDNSTREYNEPNEMKKALIRVGIPEDKITRDFAGFRTLDSILRAKAVF